MDTAGSSLDIHLSASPQHLRLERVWWWSGDPTDDLV